MRFIGICTILLISTNTSFGQLLVGSKIGLHMGKVQYEREAFQELYHANYSMGGNIGGAVTFPVLEPFSLHTELLFTTKGKSVSSPHESLKNIGRYYYIEMPIMMRIEVWPSEKIYLGIGPNLSYWMGGNGKIDDLESPSAFARYKIRFDAYHHPNDLQISEANRLQLGLLVAAGKLFKIKDDRIFSMEFRYEMGHSFLGSADGGYIESLDFTDNLQSQHRLISFNLGYFWTLHKKSARKKSSTYKAKKRAD